MAKCIHGHIIYIASEIRLEMEQNVELSEIYKGSRNITDPFIFYTDRNLH